MRLLLKSSRCKEGAEEFDCTTTNHGTYLGQGPCSAH